MKITTPVSHLSARAMMFAIVCFSVLSRAQSATVDLNDLSLEELVQIEIPNVVGASKYDQKSSQAPSSVSVITAEEIKRYGYLKLSDILRSVRGFHVTNGRDYEYIAVRGFGLPSDYSSRVLLLIDGMSINDAVFQQAAAGGDFPLDVDLIDRVEIIRGPGSALYGSSAFFAVINVVPKRGADLQGIEIAGGGGNLETQLGRLSFGKRYDNGLNLLLSASGFNRTGQEAYFFPAFQDDPSRNNGISDRGDDERWRNFYACAQFHDFTIQAGFGKRDKNFGTGVYGTVFNEPRSVVSDRHEFVNIDYRKNLSDSSELNARFYHQRYKYGSTFVIDYPPITDNHDSAEDSYWGGELRYVAKPFDRHRATLGVEYVDHYRVNQSNFDDDPALVYFEARDKRRSWGVYGQDEINLTEKLVLNVGLRYDQSYRGQSSTNPRLGFVFNPTEDTVLKLLYGTAFRAPNAFETSYIGTGIKASSNLGAEHIQTVEFAVEQNFSKNLRGIGALYKYRMKDLITQVTDPADALAVFVNSSRVDAFGVDLELQAKWPHLEGRASYTYQETESKDTGSSLPNSPRHTVKLNVLVPLIGDKLGVGFETQLLSKRTNTNGATVPAYGILNTNLLARNWIKGLEVSVGVFNLLDRDYGDPSSNDYDAAIESIPQEGRTFRVKLSYRF
jgi:outer membrane receptor for ferrienterochelin and colicins